MTRVLMILLFPFLFSNQLKSQVLPKDGSVLHYRLIGFSFPAGEEGNKYRLEIAAGNFRSEDSFSAHVIISVNSGSSKITAIVPSFGTQYTWRSVYTSGNSGKKNSGLHHFSTMANRSVDTNYNRFRIIKPAGNYKDALVFLDANKALYDMAGKPVWYLPDIEGLINERADVRDLKLSPQGTITFLVNDKDAYEIDYNGNILWKGPNNANEDNELHYHHEFTKLSNGHYMVLGTEPVLLKNRNGNPRDSAVIATSDDFKNDSNAQYYSFPFGMLIEYDQKGNKIWSWKTSKYFNGIVPDYYTPLYARNKYDVHINAFFFDEKTNQVYLGFRNISWIIKASYPSGDIEHIYGDFYKPGIPKKGNELFNGQHTILRNANGDLYVFDNNVGKLENLPRIVEFKEPHSGKRELKKIWEYQCTLEDDKEEKEKIMGFTTGGNVVEMPDNSLFVSMSSPYGKIFIVNRDKEILWSAIAEKWIPGDKAWKVMPQYRASIIYNDKDIDKMIWYGTKE